MSLDINVFWVEDDSAWYERAQVRLQSMIEEKWALGFNPTRFSTFQAARSEIKSGLENKDYALALIDYSLGGEEFESGAALIEQLRESGVYTEVIFYSKNKDEASRDLIEDRGYGLSGIFLIERGRSPQSFVEEECLPIMEAIFKKVMDLTRNRGIVAAVASDIDVELTRLITEHPEFNEKIDADFIMNSVRDLYGDKRLQDIEKKMKGKSAKDLVTDHKVSVWNVKIKIAKELLGENGILEFEKAANIIISHRNVLMHHPNPEYKERDLQDIRRKIIQCKRLLKEVFPPATKK